MFESNGWGAEGVYSIDGPANPGQGTPEAEPKPSTGSGNMGSKGEEKPSGTSSGGKK